MTPIPQMSTQPSTSHVQPNTWDTVKQWGNDFADIVEVGVVGYTTGATLGNFDEAMWGATATLTASAGYAENWNDFGNNLVVNGIANTAGLAFDAIPFLRAVGSTSGKFIAKNGPKFIKQGINSIADKMKNMYYSDED